jgi:signal transduction histidine kinase
MKKNKSIRRAVINSYLSSMLIILISIYIVIIVVFFNWENRRIESEINNSILDVHKELKSMEYTTDADIIKSIQTGIERFNLAQGAQPILHLKFVYNDQIYYSHFTEKTHCYKNKLGEFQIIFSKNNILILKNIVFEFNGNKIYMQLYSDSKEIKADIKSLLNSLFFSSIFILLITFALVKKIDGIIQTPIQEITKTAKEINRYDLSKRIHIINKNNELGKLSIVINEMIDRLDISFKSQNKFISNASHELRTPLAVIKGYADLLDAGAKTDPAMLDRGIHEILTEVKNMECLLQNLLFLARKENETLKNNILSFEVSTLIKELIEKQQLIDSDHTYTIIRNKNSTVNMDKNLILQALRELLKNSSKYTPVGGVISIDSYYKKDHHYIVIKDSGQGIPKENIKHVFERFYIQDESRNRQKNSFGLGLSIVKDIIKLHGGEISITSELNKGTVVSIKLPK